MENTIRFSRKGFNKGVNDTMTLRPLRSAISSVIGKAKSAASGKIRTDRDSDSLRSSDEWGNPSARKSGNQDDESADDDSRGGNSNHPHIGHFDADDLAKLRRLVELRRTAEAWRIVESAERQDERRHASERLGIIASVTILISSMLFVVAIIWTTGFWTTLFAVALILAVALLIRVILTGEWSDTSWFGKLIDSLARALGSVDSAKDDG